MALNNNGLGAIVPVAASGDTVITGTTVASNKNVFIRGLLIFNTSTTDNQTCEIHVVPNSGGSAGSTAAANKIGRLTLSPADTAFFEFIYPLTLTDTGDCIRVVNGSGSTVNVLPIGDVET
jgi:hypothetical protein|tara:strand:- start:1117 stop:1479 length:363 start_codon:yes stop_codon:yes gene_type:complete